MQDPRSENETKQDIDARHGGDAEIEVATPYEDVTPREAFGNRGWNEPVADAPESLEGAIRREGDPQNGAPDPTGAEQTGGPGAGGD